MCMRIYMYMYTYKHMYIYIYMYMHSMIVCSTCPGEAGRQEVATAFRRAALLNHPDKPGGSEVAMKVLTGARDHLDTCFGQARGRGVRGSPLLRRLRALQPPRCLDAGV